MVKCVPSKIYMELLNKMKDKNVPENVSDNLKEIEEEIMKNIVDNPYIIQQQMADNLHVNRKTIQIGSFLAIFAVFSSNKRTGFILKDFAIKSIFLQVKLAFPVSITLIYGILNLVLLAYCSCVKLF